MDPKPQRPRIPRRAVHGVLLLDKPLGWSSNDALQKAKRLFRAEKAGHTGTLDPLASGLLPVCFGAATKFSQISLEADKRYTATLKLGQTRRGGDLEGEVLVERPVSVTREQVAEACRRFTGEILQVPPMQSALKHDGKALYEYARAGVEVEREPRTVTVHAIELVDGAHDAWVLDVRCSKGTYIRTLAEDIGEALGCGAHLTALRRTGAGPLSVAQAVTIEALEALDEPARDALLLPPDSLVADRPAVRLAAEEAARFLAGMRRRVALADAALVRVFGPAPHASPRGPEHDVFLGTAHITAGELISTRLLSPQEVSGLLEESRP